MKHWRHLRGIFNLLAYLAPEPSLVSPRKHVAVIAALLAVAAIAGAVVLTPSHRSKPEAVSGNTCGSAFPSGRRWISSTILAQA